MLCWNITWTWGKLPAFSSGYFAYTLWIDQFTSPNLNFFFFYKLGINSIFLERNAMKIKFISSFNTAVLKPFKNYVNHCKHTHIYVCVCIHIHTHTYISSTYTYTDTHIYFLYL